MTYKEKPASADTIMALNETERRIIEIYRSVNNEGKNLLISIANAILELTNSSAPRIKELPQKGKLLFMDTYRK